MFPVIRRTASCASREAAQECSPRRKPWVHKIENEISPEGAKEKSLVPSKGLEPPHPCEYMDLNHARLPIPPRWLVDLQSSDDLPVADQEDLLLHSTDPTPSVKHRLPQP